MTRLTLNAPLLTRLGYALLVAAKVAASIWMSVLMGAANLRQGYEADWIITVAAPPRPLHPVSALIEGEAGRDGEIAEDRKMEGRIR